MANIDIPRRSKLLMMPRVQRVADDYEPINPRELLQEQLNQFVGEPDTAVTRAAIQSILWRYNFIYNDRLTIDDLNIF